MNRLSEDQTPMAHEFIIKEKRDQAVQCSELNSGGLDFDILEELPEEDEQSLEHQPTDLSQPRLPSMDPFVKIEIHPHR